MDHLTITEVNPKPIIYSRMDDAESKANPEDFIFAFESISTGTVLYAVTPYPANLAHLKKLVQMRGPQPVSVTIDITPVGMTSPEGCKRVQEAQAEWDSVTHELANVLKEFLDLDVTLCVKRGTGLVPDYDAISQIQSLIGARDRKQEAFLRAVAGR